MFSLIWNIYMIVVKTKVAEQPCTLFLFAPYSIDIIRVVFRLLSLSSLILSPFSWKKI